MLCGVFRLVKPKNIRMSRFGANKLSTLSKLAASEIDFEANLSWTRTFGLDAFLAVRSSSVSSRNLQIETLNLNVQ